MRPLQLDIINLLKVLPTINVEKEINYRKDFLKNLLLNNSLNGYVLGISGGQDSALAGKLVQEAVTEVREETGRDVSFYAVLLPYGVQKDGQEALDIAKNFIQADKIIDFNIKSGVDGLDLDFYSATHVSLADYHKGNVKARVRMIAQYALAGTNNLLVVGTDHAAENVTGFFTKFGDGAADVLPLAGLNKRQGKELLRTWKDTPGFLYTKKPTADLLDHNPQQTDETELGLTYETIDDYLEGKDAGETASQIIEKRFLATMHKRSLPLEPWM
jgi:NAD+ synthase